jgi:hypothetical protein
MTTVKELIEELQKQDPDAVIMITGRFDDTFAFDITTCKDSDFEKPLVCINTELA